MTAVSFNERRRLLAQDGITLSDIQIGPGPTGFRGGMEVSRFPATLFCSRCKRRIVGWLAFDITMAICDSGGFMHFGKKSVCDDCLGEHNA